MVRRHRRSRRRISRGVRMSSDDSEAEGATYLTDPGFEPGRLRLARELKGWSQAELARQLGLTPAAVSQFESGATSPGASSLKRLATSLDAPSAFFDLPLTETHEGFFRSLRRSSVTGRRRARAIAHIAH